MNRIIFFIISCFLTNISYCVENDAGQFEQVLSVIAAPNVFSLSVEQMQQKLNGLCSKSTLPDSERLKHGNMVCVKDVGVDLLTISGGRNIGLISAIFSRSSDCDFIRKTLVANFGKPNKVTSECAVDWDLKPLKKGGPQRHVGFEVDKKENKTYLSIGEDQGP